MPITLAEAKVGMADKVDQQIVDPPCSSTASLSTTPSPPVPAAPRSSTAIRS